MNEDSSRKSSRRSCKSTTGEEVNTNTIKRRQWNAHNLICHWNLTCKALSIGLVLMIIGGSMATIGYFLDHISTSSNNRGNDTVTRDKSKMRVNFQSFATYVGPMIMGVGGFIVVAACVMTFEQRDNAAKVIPGRLQLNTTHSHSINRHNKPSPSSRQPLREGSGRRTTQGTAAYQVEPSEDFGRRELTTDFIHFSRNLQQANIEKTIAKQAMGRSPSAPNLAVSPDLLSNKALSPRHHAKLSRNSLHPLIGQPFLSPHTLHRQAVSVDNSEYYPQNVSPPRSKRSSRQGSTSTGQGSAESLEAELATRRLHSSQASMMLDLHMPSDCPISMRIRDRNRRSDTARRHMFVRQAQIENEEDSVERGCDSRCSSPQFGARATTVTVAAAHGHSSSTPHSRRESYSPRMSSIDDPAYQYRCRLNEIVLRSSSPSLQHKRSAYLRSNTVCNEPSSYRRSSNTSESGQRKGSADYHYHRNRRKSSNTSDSSRYCSRTNVDEARCRNRSPTSSLRSFQELRYLTQKLNENELKNDAHSKQKDCGKRKPSSKCKHTSPKGRGSKVIIHQSLSPDSASISSTTTEGHSKSDFTSVDVESTEDGDAKKSAAKKQ